ncbi:TetR/AcrR family transcriptional regulator [Mycolicibacterium pulveris]|uniref:TetR/AcrR family transcriptional regulator n=1 Tax=Mycolicibacterium pulveris TaxID=36813 RepID=UPI003CEF10D3
MTTVSQPRTRARRTTRPSGDEREQAILATAERLLEARPFSEISVDDLAKGAGISRPTFYFYFPSKNAVLLTLLERVIAEANADLEALVANPPTDRHEFWRAGIGVFYSTFRAHRAMVAPATVARYTNAEFRDLWAAFMQRSIDHTTAVIESLRARGEVPENLPAGELSTSLNLLNEAVMTASFAGQQPALPDERVLDNLVHIWLNAIYGDAP